MSATRDGAIFEGDFVVQGGGFASVRCAPGLQFPGAQGFRLEGQSDGRVGYKMVIKTDDLMDGVMYQANINAQKTSSVLNIPFSAFSANFRGQPVPNAPPLRGENIVQLGFMLSRSINGERNSAVDSGPFSLRLSALEVY
jgi:hypothetical protein